MASNVGRTSLGERLRSVMGIAARGGDLTRKEMGELESRFQRFMREADISGAMLPGIGVIGQVRAATRAPAARFLRGVFEKGMKKLPEFKHTEDALIFGAEHARNPQVLKQLFETGQEMTLKTREMRKLPRTTEGIQEVFELGVKRQLIREALEGADEALGRSFIDYQALWRTTIEGAKKAGARVGGGALPKKGLVVANIGADGKIYYGAPGDIHHSLSERYGRSIRKTVGLKPGEGTWTKVGWADETGEFLTREEALKKLPSTFKSTLKGELDALDYFFEQTGGR